MLIRPATVNDAEEAASIMRRSIRELCTLDHGEDAAVLAQWLRNKTAESVGSWIEARDRCLLVAEDGGRIVGVGSASKAGEIVLNYVAPEARFRGTSKSVVRALEAYLRDQGCAESRLVSTRTAHAFYLSLGYQDEGEAERGGAVAGQPMRKSL